MQPCPLRKTVEEFETSRKHKIEHTMNIGKNEIDLIKHEFTRDFLNIHLAEDTKYRKKAMMKA